MQHPRSHSHPGTHGLVALVAAALLHTGGAFAPSMASKEDPRTFGLVFLTVKDRPLFDAYCEESDAIVKKHGGGIERSIVPSGMFGHGLAKPDLVNVTFMPSVEAQQAFMADPEFRRLVPKRTASSDIEAMISVRPTTIKGVRTSTGTSQVKDRFYMIELVYYDESDGDGEAYRRHFRKAAKVMREYGFHLERSFVPVGARGVDKPDLINVMYFDLPEGYRRFQQDREHREIETAYQAVVRNAIWIVGETAP